MRGSRLDLHDLVFHGVVTVDTAAGPKRVLEYDTDHYVDFTNARPEFERELEAWLLEQRP